MKIGMYKISGVGGLLKAAIPMLIAVVMPVFIDAQLQPIKSVRSLRPNGLPYAKPERTRTYVGDFVFENDTLAMVNFQGGYFDSRGLPHYRHTDWQGNVTMVTDRAGQLVQHTGYYPYGEPWREPTGQPYLFGGKERLRENALNEYNFTARRYHSALALWTTPDPKSTDEPWNNQYVYCNANPIKFLDKTGKKGELVVTNNSITLRGRFYAAGNSVESAKYGADIINNLSNTIVFEAKNKETGVIMEIPLIFDVTVEEVPLINNNERASISNYTVYDPIGNAYMVVPDNYFGVGVTGRAEMPELSSVTLSFSKTETTAHEQLHNLGINHHNRGIMTESHKDPKRSNKLDKNGVLNDIKKLIDNPNNTDKINIIIVEDLEFKINNLKLSKK